MASLNFPPSASAAVQTPESSTYPTFGDLPVDACTQIFLKIARHFEEKDIALIAYIEEDPALGITTLGKGLMVSKNFSSNVNTFFEQISAERGLKISSEACQHITYGKEFHEWRLVNRVISLLKCIFGPLHPDPIERGTLIQNSNFFLEKSPKLTNCFDILTEFDTVSEKINKLGTRFEVVISTLLEKITKDSEPDCTPKNILKLLQDEIFSQYDNDYQKKLNEFIKNNPDVLFFISKVLLSAAEQVSDACTLENILKIVLDENYTWRGPHLKKLKELVKSNPEVLSFITKVFLTATEDKCNKIGSFPDLKLHSTYQFIRTLFIKGLELWKDNKKSPLELMLMHLLHQMQRRKGKGWVYKLLNDLYQDETNRIAPIILSFACAKMYKTNRTQGNILPDIVANPDTSIEKDLEALHSMEVPERLLYPIMECLDEDAIFTSLHEPSATHFFVPLLEKMNPRPTKALLSIVRKEIRLKNYEKAESLFIEYLREKWQIHLEKASVEHMSKNEIEVLCFFQSRLINSKYLLDALQDYQNLLEKLKNSPYELATTTKIFARSTIAMIDGLSRVGRFDNGGALQISNFLDRHLHALTPEEAEFHQKMQQILPTLHQMKTNLLTFDEIDKLFKQHSFALLPYIVAAISKSSYQQEYLPTLCKLLEAGISLWEFGQKDPLEEALVILANSENSWALECLAKLYENPANRIIPIIFSLSTTVLNFEYRRLRYGLIDQENRKSHEQVALNVLPNLIEELQKADLSQKWLRYLMELILENEPVDPFVGESLADKFLPVLAKINPQPVEFILLSAKQKYRSKNFPESQALYKKYLLSKPFKQTLPSEYLLQPALNIANGKYADALEQYESLMKAYKQFFEWNPYDIMNVRMFVRASIGAVNVKLQLNEITEAKKICNELEVLIPIELIPPDVQKFIETVKNSQPSII